MRDLVRERQVGAECFVTIATLLAMVDGETVAGVVLMGRSSRSPSSSSSSSPSAAGYRRRRTAGLDRTDPGGDHPPPNGRADVRMCVNCVKLRRVRIQGV